MTSINRVKFSPNELAVIYLVEANRNKPRHTFSPNEIASLMPFVSRYLETLERIEFSDTETFVRYCNTMLGFVMQSSTGINTDPMKHLVKFCEDKLDMKAASSKPGRKAMMPKTEDPPFEFVDALAAKSKQKTPKSVLRVEQLSADELLKKANELGSDNPRLKTVEERLKILEEFATPITFTKPDHITDSEAHAKGRNIVEKKK